MAITPKGVRMINDNVVQDGLGLVVNKRDVMDWNQIPNGSLFVDKNGVMMMKVEGETDWIPAGIRNDGTLVISRDTSLHVETFTITSLDNGDGTFTYINSDGEQRYKPKEADGLVFQLEKGTYLPGRNHLTVVYDDVLERSAASGGIIEIDETRFKVTENIPVGTELTVKYIKWVRIGNPYPRWYEAYAEPVDAEVGDFFLDLGTDIEDAFGTIGEVDETDTTGNISWSRIIGTPTLLSGYHITDAAYKIHTHNTSDIIGLASYVDGRAGSVADNKIQTAISGLTTKLQNGTIKVAKATNADKATNATTADNAKKLVNLVPDTAKTGGTSAANKIAVYDANGKIPTAALPKIETFIKGMIIDWFGASNKVPTGWAICDGRTVNGIQTPNLVGKFIIGGDTSGTYKGSTSTSDMRQGGSSTFTRTGSTTVKATNIPKHRHDRGTMNITGTFSGVGEYYDGVPNTVTGAFYRVNTAKYPKGGAEVKNGGDPDDVFGFDASKSWTGYTGYAGGNSDGKADPIFISIDTTPPYVALFKIMYVGA